jgi:magnesium transporter
VIRTIGVTNDYQIKKDMPLTELSNDFRWHWVDFNAPSDEEIGYLYSHFRFHPLAVEDCLHALQRPKLDYYDGYDFYVIHTFDKVTFKPIEIDFFVGENFIVTFHSQPLSEIDTVLKNLPENEKAINKGILYIFYLILDKIVDEFFPTIYQLEDHLNDMETKEETQDIIREIFDIRHQLLKLRRTIVPMSELLYRVLNSERVKIPKEDRVYFMDIHDHVMRLSEIIDSNREMTNDIRDSYISINSYRMNNIMKTLTVLTSIFIPLTFIASIYGMNFEYIPELSWRYGYFFVLGLMLLCGVSMLFALWRKGWFK